MALSQPMSISDPQKLSSELVNFITKDTLQEEDKIRFMEGSVTYWNEHVNPGFLKYRKSMSDDYAAVEWTDSGSTFKDIRGREFIDCLGGFGIFNVGHRHPTVLKAVKAQLDRQALHSQELIDGLRPHLARLLKLLTPPNLQYTFFTNSGTESVEGALKMAMMATGRRNFVAALRGFHGKTLGALGGTSKAVFRKPFALAVPFSHVAFGDIDDLRHTFESSQFTGNDIAGVILEPIQGEGGIYVAPDGYLQAVRELCDQYGAMLIFDEVQTGMGRTGKMFAFEHWGVTPDILCLGKAFGGGVMPAGCFMAGPKAWAQYIDNPVLHSTTFGGNPLACAAAISTINVILEENLIQKAAENGSWFIARWKELMARFPRLLVDVRGLGFMIGLEFSSQEIGYAFAKGLFMRNVLTAGTYISAKVIRIEPPLVITKEELQSVISRAEASLKEVEAVYFGISDPPARKLSV